MYKQSLTNHLHPGSHCGKWIRNSMGSMLLIRARTNTLKLNWRNRFTGEEERCPGCEDQETLEHFLLHCKEYAAIRSKIVCLQQPYPENTASITARILILTTNHHNQIQESEKYLIEIWKQRKLIIKAKLTQQ